MTSRSSRLDDGSIVNITSVEAHRAAPGYAVYAAMKAAVESLSQSLALELGPRRIRCNTIAPDAVYDSLRRLRAMRGAAEKIVETFTRKD